ncbi:MAG: hypothetical protein HC874_26145 [Richelia sp. SL_2_1]|nr:hypothetical protein [Richelia sp. SL_2_1]
MDLLEQLRISSGAVSCHKRNGHYIQLSYETLRARRLGQRLLQKAGWAAYPLNTRKSYSLEIYVTDDKIALEVEPKRAAGDPKDILIKHINAHTPQLKANVEDTSTVELCTDGKYHIVPGEQFFYEISKDRLGKYVIFIMGGPLGSQRIQFSYDYAEVKAYTRGEWQGRGKNRVCVKPGLEQSYGYLNWFGTWSESWYDEDGKSTKRLEGVTVKFKLDQAKRSGEIFEIDSAEYYSTCEELKSQNYRAGIGAGTKNDDGEEDTWLLSATMNIAR